ncbi:symmetrical bis(5'-nucleosyl)-tetraphosphatase [Colwellia psychrerythraea]|uniref:Bis(5'-nucleosyl)-tetraphosphatase, symmetrical n=1 Tax=Colwellia psychrerythraea TaxID=28229 RepID=A0A099KU08_COLPS|nr:symmetrical bis(5'-nucleosyl)-tetraphosphatase [Colwellia psychrerythraea]KGJ94264.1 Bis(5'-nucleosyl)-tetraphosphatase, symmetrical [Colwellia psychrerythraea]
MAIYLVGDIQGCFNELTSLLSQVNFDRNSDVLYLAGDLVARGPNSLETLRFVKSLGECAKVVLGNHDLHLLAVYAGIKKTKKSDHLSELLAAPDIKELMDWLAGQPLIQKIPNPGSNSTSVSSTNKASNDYAYMTHAGISPQWQLSDALEQAELIQTKLTSPDRNTWLALMYGEKPNDWHQAITDVDKFRYSINALTRMRFCFMDGALEFDQKDSPEAITVSNIVPWFELSQTINNTHWVFGHWASLMGKSSHPNIYPLDTGCVWGNQLTMLRWHDKKYFIQSSELSD